MKKTGGLFILCSALLLGQAALAQNIVAPGAPGRRMPAPGRPDSKFPYAARLAFSYGAKKERKLALFLTTTKIYNSGGYKLKVDTKVDGKTVNISIRGVEGPPKGGMVTMALAPARGTVTLPEKKGEYDLSISGNGTVETLKFSIGDDTIELKSPKTTTLFGDVAAKYNTAPKNVFSVNIIKNRRGNGDDLTAQVKKDLEALPGVRKYEPKKGQYLCKGGWASGRYASFYIMEKGLDFDALSKVIAKYKAHKQMYIDLRVPFDGRSVRNR